MNQLDADDGDARWSGSRGRPVGRDGLLTTADLGSSHTTELRSSRLDTDALLHQIKRSFDQETKSFRSRIVEATDEAARARERIDDVHEEMLRLRKKCHKLQRRLQERDATIACMQEQHDLQLPMLMHETMRSLQLDNQDEVEEAKGMRASVHRNRLQRSILREQQDERVHEYEKQISRLYEELHQEKQKNEMLQECLKEQKRAKAKLMKACKFARREIEALKESDLSHLLEDMEIKCRELEHKNSTLQHELDLEKTQAANARQERDDIEDELAARRQDASDWAARLDAKQREIERLRTQIHEQQRALENFQQDYDLVAERTVDRSDSSMHVELQQECDLLIRALHRERARVADLEQQLQDTTSHRERCRSRSRSREAEDSSTTDNLHGQIECVRDKIRRLHHQLREFTETQGLSSSSSLGGSFQRSATEERASDVLTQCERELDALQRRMEEAFARALGSNCAMQ